MTLEEIDTLTDELRGLIAERLGIRAKSFAQAVKRTNRLLPTPVRNSAQALLAFQARAAHPKLAARTDPALVQAEAETVKRHLMTLKAGERQARERAFLFGEIAFRVAIVLVLIVVLLVWRDII